MAVKEFVSNRNITTRNVQDLLATLPMSRLVKMTEYRFSLNVSLNRSTTWLRTYYAAKNRTGLQEDRLGLWLRKKIYVW